MLDARSGVRKVGVVIVPKYVSSSARSNAASHTISSCRRLADEDDELSEVQPDAVPPEVREWLASTFTRQLATTRRKADEKPKFRSVAHAIRAGIFVDRIYRRVTNTALMQFPSEVVKVLKVIHAAAAAHIRAPTRYTARLPIIYREQQETFPCEEL